MDHISVTKGPPIKSRGVGWHWTPDLEELSNFTVSKCRRVEGMHTEKPEKHRRSGRKKERK